MSIGARVVWLVVLAIPIACIARTIHEEVFREPREFCVERSRNCPRWYERKFYERKFFYLFTCEYCFSHCVTIFFLAITRYKLLYQDWRGYLISGFALVYVANFYMSLFGFVRLDITKERTEIQAIEREVEQEEPPRIERPAA